MLKDLSGVIKLMFRVIKINHLSLLTSMLKITKTSQAAELLKSGGILAHPADTCFGLAGDLMKEEVLKKIQLIKGREADKPMSIMVSQAKSEERRAESSATKKSSTLHAPRSPLENYVLLDDFSRRVCAKLLPGPVTIVLPKGPKIPKWYFPETEWIGIRMVDDEQVNELLKAFGGPIITTSANLSSQPTCYTAEEVIEIFENQDHKPDGILMGEILEKKLPSTVIKVEDGKIIVLREGPLEISNFKF